MSSTGLRLNKYLAQAGVCSRRAADGLVEAGRVAIDGVVVTELGTRVDVDRQVVSVDGRVVRLEESKVHFAFHKPVGVECTDSPHGRHRRVLDFMPKDYGRLFLVGRLDMDSRGLILVTNDGAFAQRIAHPSYEVKKEYAVRVQGRPRDADIDRIRAGMDIGGVVTSSAAVELVEEGRGESVFRITLGEGRNREVRRLFARVGCPVLDLQRVAVGSVRLGDLAEGQYRALSAKEIREFAPSR